MTTTNYYARTTKRLEATEGATHHDPISQCRQYREARPRSYHLPLDSPGLQHSDPRIHLQSVRQASELRSENSVCICPDHDSLGIVDVERTRGSPTFIEKTGDWH